MRESDPFYSSIDVLCRKFVCDNAPRATKPDIAYTGFVLGIAIAERGSPKNVCAESSLIRAWILSSIRVPLRVPTIAGESPHGCADFRL